MAINRTRPIYHRLTKLPEHLTEAEKSRALAVLDEMLNAELRATGRTEDVERQREYRWGVGPLLLGTGEPIVVRDTDRLWVYGYAFTVDGSA